MGVTQSEYSERMPNHSEAFAKALTRCREVEHEAASLLAAVGEYLDLLDGRETTERQVASSLSEAAKYLGSASNSLQEALRHMKNAENLLGD